MQPVTPVEERDGDPHENDDERIDQQAREECERIAKAINTMPPVNMMRDSTG
ncbi:MAG TPA: hypothetical protein VGB05_06025 [Pyrinomonadaceae bacterium]